MKLKTRIIVGFVAIILLPLLLFSASLYGFSQTQAKHVQESSSQASDSSQMVYDISLPQSSSSQVKLMAKDMILTATIILVFTALSVGLWIYRSIAVPLVKLKKATKNIKEGNLDFVLEVEGNDEFSQLCQDFEEMRKRLKESTEEKILIMGVVRSLNFLKSEKPDIQKIFHGDFIARKVMNRPIAGQGVNMVRELLMYTLMWKMKNLT